MMSDEWKVMSRERFQTVPCVMGGSVGNARERSVEWKVKSGKTGEGQ